MRDCLLAGAVGDALGAPIEFASLAQIRARYGPLGVVDYDQAYGRLGAVTDDTQMTLFTLEGLIRASVRQRSKGIAHVPSVVQHAYQRWLHTQGKPWREASGPFAVGRPSPDGWLVTVSALHNRRAPGKTCLGSLLAFPVTETLSTIEKPANQSKGCGGVMRAAPAGFWPAPLSVVFDLGCQLAALTHGHPSGYLAAGVIGAVVSRLLNGSGLPSALDDAMTLLRERPGHEEVDQAVTSARALAATGTPEPEAIETLGGGWVAEEALAIAVCAALGGTDLRDALLRAVNHSGDSDSTGAIAGHLLGAWYGGDAIPKAWLERLELADVIETLAADAAREFGSDPPGAPDWLERYPPW